jgi:hypothetical protein
MEGDNVDRPAKAALPGQVAAKYADFSSGYVMSPQSGTRMWGRLL